MFVLIPFATLIIFTILLLGHFQKRSANQVPWQGAFLLAFSFWGAYLVLLTEGSSFFKMALTLADCRRLVACPDSNSGDRPPLWISPTRVSRNAFWLPFLDPLRDRFT